MPMTELPNYWFLRMRHGTDGDEFAKELWEKDRAGILWGPWRIEDALDDNDEVSSAALKRLFKRAPMNAYPRQGLECAIRFCCDTNEDDHVLVTYDGMIHIGVIADEEINTDETPRPTPDDPSVIEYVKYVRLRDRKEFDLAKLPSSFWLIPQTGRGTFQRIGRTRPLAKLLASSADEAEVCKRILDFTPDQLLDILPAAGWESLCLEYLRESIGFRSLLLAAGRSLEGIDIVGVDRNYKRVVAQCKNDPLPIAARNADAWMAEYGRRGDRAYYFARGGIKGPTESHCEIVTQREITAWLESRPDYFCALKQQ